MTTATDTCPTCGSHLHPDRLDPEYVLCLLHGSIFIGPKRPLGVPTAFRKAPTLSARQRDMLAWMQGQGWVTHRQIDTGLGIPHDDRSKTALAGLWTRGLIERRIVVAKQRRYEWRALEGEL